MSSQQPSQDQPVGGPSPGGWQPPQPAGWQPNPTPAAPPAAQPGASEPSSSTERPAWDTAVAQRPAGFWIRVVAYIIDAVILGVFNLVVTFVVALAAGGSIQGTPVGLLYLVEFLVAIGYFSYMWSSRGQTIGMMATNLQVIREDGSRLTLGQAIGRAFALVLSFLILYIGVIMVAFTARKQGLHDMICHTLVVHKS
jgi:uncharacterized RDD family membrane protein YckC